VIRQRTIVFPFVLIAADRSLSFLAQLGAEDDCHVSVIAGRVATLERVEQVSDEENLVESAND
jgi:hypothetical protein